MQSTDRHRQARQIAHIRAFPTPESISAARANDNLPAAPLVLPCLRPTTARRPDGIDRTGLIVALDGEHRIAATKVTKPLGWEPGIGLVARCTGDRATITAGRRLSPADLSIRLDTCGRLTLPPTICGALDLLSGDQVVAIAVPATGELILVNAAGPLAELTGPIEAPVMPEPAEPAPPRPASRIRAAWRPDDAV